MKCWCTTDIKKTFIYFFNMHVAVWLPGQVFFHFCCSAVLMEAPRIKDITFAFHVLFTWNGMRFENNIIPSHFYAVFKKILSKCDCDAHMRVKITHVRALMGGEVNQIDKAFLNSTAYQTSDIFFSVDVSSRWITW